MTIRLDNSRNDGTGIPPPEPWGADPGAGPLPEPWKSADGPGNSDPELWMYKFNPRSGDPER